MISQNFEKEWQILRHLKATNIPRHFIQTRGDKDTYETLEGQYSSTSPNVMAGDPYSLLNWNGGKPIKT